MALTVTVSPKELERQVDLAFTGKPYKVFLAYDPNGTLTAASTAAAWEALELAASNGYLAVSGTVGTGSYNSTAGRFELPVIAAAFNASGAGYVYDSLVVVIDDATYPHSVAKISPEVALLAGQVRTYQVRLAQDD